MIRVGGRRVATNAANFTKGDVVGVVLDADQGEIVFFRNGVEQGRARGIRGRCVPWGWGCCASAEWSLAEAPLGAASAEVESWPERQLDAALAWPCCCCFSSTGAS